MKTRILIAAMALVFGFSSLAQAGKEEVTHVGHKLKAVFPDKTTHSEKKTEGTDGPITVESYSCEANNKFLQLGIVKADKLELKHEDLEARAQEFIEGVDQEAKNMKVIKRGVSDLNKNCPSGYWFLVKHDGGVALNWLTISDNKLYVVSVHAKSEKDLGDEVKAFLNSVEIAKK
jgi:hypothetical protein